MPEARWPSAVRRPVPPAPYLARGGTLWETGMKAFISGVVVAIVLAVGASYVLEGYLSVPASRAFAMPDVRVGHNVTVEGRRFSPGT